jgi:hypothetical protein
MFDGAHVRMRIDLNCTTSWHCPRQRKWSTGVPKPGTTGRKGMNTEYLRKYTAKYLWNKFTHVNTYAFVTYEIQNDEFEMKMAIKMDI